MAVRADQSGSFFTQQRNAPSNTSLITGQIDPTQPQAIGLEKVSDPIIPVDHSTEIVKNFDPDLYDLKYSSHLMRLIRALTGASGVGGLRKQSAIARMAASISSANFVDLDRFYGALFNFRRQSSEQMPVNNDGTTVNPITDVTDADTWDDVQSRDARFRSRLHEMARALNMGGTYPGLKGVAEAILGTEVDLIESWVKADAYYEGTNVLYPTGMTFGQISAQSVNWGNINSSYGGLGGSQFGQSDPSILPTGNRGEIVLTPRRIVTTEERYQLMQVMRVLKPANTQITLAKQQNVTIAPIRPKNLSADSENWSVQSRVTPAIGLIQPPTPLYPNAGEFSVARPAFSDYSGESWSYNANITRTSSYQMDQYENITATGDDESVVYQDNVTHVYVAADGVMDARQASSTRLSGEGVVTNFPYSPNRGS